MVELLINEIDPFLFYVIDQFGTIDFAVMYLTSVWYIVALSTDPAYKTWAEIRAKGMQFTKDLDKQIDSFIEDIAQTDDIELLARGLKSNRIALAELRQQPFVIKLLVGRDHKDTLHQWERLGEAIKFRMKELEEFNDG